MENNQRKFITLVIFITSVLLAINTFISYNTSSIKMFCVPYLIVLLSYLFILYRLKLLKEKKNYLYLIPIILIIISEFLVDVATSNYILNIIFLMFYIPITLVFMINKDISISRSIYKFIFKVFPGKFFSNLRLIKVKDKKEQENKNKESYTGVIILTILLSLFILGLLRSADLYFDELISNITYYFNIETILEVFIKAILLFIPMFSVIIGIINNKEAKLSKEEDKNINSTSSKIILISVNVIYLLFLISEVSKLTNNFLKLPIEYTYAEYAREGFFQLLLITLINYIIITYHKNYTQITNVKKNNVLVNILITFSITLIINSFYRLYLYINFYGFTVLRCQVALFLIMELIVFLSLYKKYKNRNNYYKLLTCLLITTYIINVYTCSSSVTEIINENYNYVNKYTEEDIESIEDMNCELIEDYENMD